MMILLALLSMAAYSIVSSFYIVALSRRIAHLEGLVMKGGLEVETHVDLETMARVQRHGR